MGPNMEKLATKYPWIYGYFLQCDVLTLVMQGIGEPPLLLSCAAFYALRSAVRSARHDAGLPSQFEFDSPATVRKILLALPATARRDTCC